MTRHCPDFLAGFAQAKEMAARECARAMQYWWGVLEYRKSDAATYLRDRIVALSPPEPLAKDQVEEKIPPGFSGDVGV